MNAAIIPFYQERITEEFMMELFMQLIRKETDMNKRFLLGVYICMILCFSSVILSFAAGYKYDISEKTGIKMEFIERDVGRICDNKMSTGGNDNSFSIQSYDLENAFVATPINDYLMITAHKKGKTLENMSADYCRLIVPIVNSQGCQGNITFKCENSHATYLGMGVASGKGRIPGVDMVQINDICLKASKEVNNINIYVNDMYHLYFAAVDTTEGRYIISTSKMNGVNDNIEAYTLYSEEDFWNKMDTIYDEDALARNGDSDGGGVPLKINEKKEINTDVGGVRVDETNLNKSAATEKTDIKKYTFICIILIVVGTAGICVGVSKIRKRR